MPTTILDGQGLRAVMQRYAELLRSHREVINRLNVYPVPDGDTGTNMALTMESVVAEIGDRSELADVCAAVAHGSLMGARGNSGVILSQILRGLTDVLKGRPELDTAALTDGLEEAAAAAYRAVQRPVEGTILTVARESAHAAAAARDGSLVAALDAARQAAAESLARTPDLLPVLARAGVVDAGGRGLVLLYDAFLCVVDGRPAPEPELAAAPELEAVPGAAGDVADLRYEVMYFLEAPDDRIDAFRTRWAEIGDSIVVVGGDGTWNCHIHTDDIGAAIEAGIEAGRPRSIRVTDLLEEVEERAWVEEALGAEAPAGAVTTAVVAVAAGEGIVRILRSLGVQRVVTGGQTMNPSTADLLDAVERVDAQEVVILPNNKNIVPVAEQVDSQTSKTVRVVPSTCIPEGFAALLSYDPEAGAAENAEAMKAALAQVVAGEVTWAVRDSTSDAGPIRTGDALGISRGNVLVVRDSIVAAATALLDELIDGHELVTILPGADAREEDTEAIVAWLQEQHPDVEVEVHEGGQPLYPYYLGVE